VSVDSLTTRPLHAPTSDAAAHNPPISPIFFLFSFFFRKMASNGKVTLILCITMCVGASGWENAAAIMDTELSKAEGLIPTL
jgi:hypothetical protein